MTTRSINSYYPWDMKGSSKSRVPVWRPNACDKHPRRTDVFIFCFWASWKHGFMIDTRQVRSLCHSKIRNETTYKVKDDLLETNRCIFANLLKSQTQFCGDLQSKFFPNSQWRRRAPRQLIYPAFRSKSSQYPIPNWGNSSDLTIKKNKILPVIELFLGIFACNSFLFKNKTIWSL